jgi:hypothetical protein
LKQCENPAAKPNAFTLSLAPSTALEPDFIFCIPGPAEEPALLFISLLQSHQSCVGAVGFGHVKAYKISVGEENTFDVYLFQPANFATAQIFRRREK